MLSQCNFQQKNKGVSRVLVFTFSLSAMLLLGGCKNTLISSAQAQDNQMQVNQAQVNQAQIKQTQDVSSAYDCTQVTLQDIDESLLTKEEKLALLDDALSDSIDAYSTCVSTVQTDMASASGQTAGGGGGVGDGAENGSANSAGTQTEQGDARNQQASASNENDTQEFESGGMQAGSEPVAESTSTTTEVQRGIVTPKDNDSIICKLLFAEIEKAQGSAKSGLEKQYKEYQCGK